MSSMRGRKSRWANIVVAVRCPCVRPGSHGAIVVIVDISLHPILDPGDGGDSCVFFYLTCSPRGIWNYRLHELYF